MSNQQYTSSSYEEHGPGYIDSGENVKKIRTPEQRSEIARKRNAARTPEQWSEIARKRNTTRLLNKQSKLK